MKRLSHSSSQMSFPRSTPVKEHISQIDPVFVDDPTVTRLNSKNHLRSAPNLNWDTNSYSETQIVIKDYSSDDEKLDKDFREYSLYLLTTLIIFLSHSLFYIEYIEYIEYATFILHFTAEYS